MSSPQLIWNHCRRELPCETASSYHPSWLFADNIRRWLASGGLVDSYTIVSIGNEGMRQKPRALVRSSLLAALAISQRYEQAALSMPSSTWVTDPGIASAGAAEMTRNLRRSTSTADNKGFGKAAAHYVSGSGLNPHLNYSTRG